MVTQVAQARNMSTGEHRHCCVTFKIKGFVWENKSIVSVTYENERISIKNSLPYSKCVLRLSCVVHGPIYGRFMGLYGEKPVYINWRSSSAWIVGSMFGLKHRREMLLLSFELKRLR